MAYREVTMIETTEVLRQWLAGARTKRIARRLGLDPKTVRRYVRAAADCELAPGMDAAALTDERLAAVPTKLRGGGERPYGETWQSCVEHRDFIADRLKDGLRLSKVHDSGATTCVALGLPHPLPQRLRRAADLARDRSDRRPLRFVVALVLQDHPHRPLPHLPREPARSSHGSFLSKKWSLRETRSGSTLFGVLEATRR